MENSIFCIFLHFNPFTILFVNNSFNFLIFFDIYSSIIQRDTTENKVQYINHKKTQLLIFYISTVTRWPTTPWLSVCLSMVAAKMCHEEKGKHKASGRWERTREISTNHRKCLGLSLSPFGDNDTTCTHASTKKKTLFKLFQAFRKT